jgi:hypothetical protein
MTGGKGAWTLAPPAFQYAPQALHQKAGGTSGQAFEMTVYFEIF